jgi:hypothetical protein
VSNKFIEKFLLFYSVFMVLLSAYYYFDNHLFEFVDLEKLAAFISESSQNDVVLSVENIINEPMFNLVMQTFFIVVISS